MVDHLYIFSSMYTFIHIYIFLSCIILFTIFIQYSNKIHLIDTTNFIPMRYYYNNSRYFGQNSNNSYYL
jgi:hypothetical protein